MTVSADNKEELEMFQRFTGREAREIIIVTALTLLLPIFSMSLHLIERVYAFSSRHELVGLTEYLINFCFLYLTGLLFITYRRWLKAERRRKELDNIISSINPDVLLVVDRQRRIRICNQTVQRMFGYGVEEVKQGTTDLLYFDRRSYPAENKQEIYEILESEGFHVGMATGKRRDGSTFPLEIITGNVSGGQGAVLLLRDITSRKKAEDELLRAHNELEIRVRQRTEDLVRQSRKLSQEIEERKLQEEERKIAEEKLRESEERYRTVIENSNDGIAIVRDDRFAYVNRKYAHIFGYGSPEELEGLLVLSLVHPDDEAKVHQINLMKQIDRSHVARYEFRGVKKNREQIFLDASETSINYMGAPVFLSYVRDITERKSLESQLRHAQKMEAIGQLAGGVAHDFNNILTALIGYGDLLRMQIKDDNPLRNYVNEILKTSQSASRLTQSLLAFSRKQVIDLKPCKISTVIQGAERLLGRLLSEDIALVIDLDDEGATALADPNQIEQVLINLATNAHDAMPGGGTLRISTRTTAMDQEFIKEHGYGKPGRYVHLVIADTGCGIGPEVREKIFDPFFTTKEVGKGTGLGLSIVYGIIKQHDGYINVASEIGAGTSFHIYLPITKLEMIESKPTFRPAVGGTETVLIAEDNHDVRAYIINILRTFGYRTLEAEDGQEAVSVFEHSPDKIDLVIADVVMPKKNGKEVYKEITRINPDTKLLFMSGYTGDVVFDKGILDTDRNFIAKPFVPGDLLVRVREMLDG
jgi:PAS domain S-box-containing protein